MRLTTPPRRGFGKGRFDDESAMTFSHGSSRFGSAMQHDFPKSGALRPCHHGVRAEFEEIEHDQDKRI
jgi:hypothetical protein